MTCDLQTGGNDDEIMGEYDSQKENSGFRSSFLFENYSQGFLRHASLLQ
jgi:hypothetical protein